MLILVFLLSLPIITADLSAFKIPNMYIKVMCYGLILLFVLNGLGPIRNLASFILVLFALHLARFGMGDIKLLLIIGCTLNTSSKFDSFALFQLLFLCGGLQLLLMRLCCGAFSRKIALAPSIYLALGAYLATSL